MDDSDRLINSEAFVITQTDFGEADRFYTVFTRKRGKIKAFARGVRKSRSRKAGHLQPLSLIHLMLAKGKTFWIITQSDTINAYMSIKNDLAKTASALYVFELLDRFAPEDEPLFSLFTLVKETMSRIEEEEDIFLPIKFYELRLLKYTGYMPNLVTCVQCGKEIQPQDQYFSAERGGVLCPTCGVQVYRTRKITLSALKYLRYIQRNPYRKFEKVNPSSSVRTEIDAIMLYYLTYITEKKLNTPAFMNQIKEQDEKKE
ncbi:MAG TPA: DNA repair protein RecO [Anaerolineaceae bacterium]|uniref:DNA repair protein RecO n=1 Tax=Anaerolinea thermophila TaxID=167964 RepID=A0A124FMZ9_9CHLR|nr:MAG: DNA repair protein RecO [Anaerolinea thermophila]HAF62628.1 DNA repair protein RecO [Anaerolineaceae bacterium]